MVPIPKSHLCQKQNKNKTEYHASMLKTKRYEVIYCWTESSCLPPVKSNPMRPLSLSTCAATTEFLKRQLLTLAPLNPSCAKQVPLVNWRKTTGAEMMLLKPKSSQSPAAIMSCGWDSKYPTVVCSWVEIYESLTKSLYYHVLDPAKATKHPSKCLLSVFGIFSFYILKLCAWLQAKKWHSSSQKDLSTYTIATPEGYHENENISKHFQVTHSQTTRISSNFRKFVKQFFIACIRRAENLEAYQQKRWNLSSERSLHKLSTRFK